jgi:HAD superfamily hydrolase (TIGR01509 family)
MAAIFFGSISTIADTSEMQRAAFNRAFEAHGLAWHWGRDEYLGLLEHSGGEERIAAYARSTGDDVDAAAVHATKSHLFQDGLAGASLVPRPGVVDVIAAARAKGTRLGLVTTTSAANVAALLEALRPAVSPDDFDVVVDSSSVERPKPDAAAYTYALASVGERPDDCVAIEDNLDGLAAARAAGLRCIAFPNENTAGHDFELAERLVDRLDPVAVHELVAVG